LAIKLKLGFALEGIVCSNLISGCTKCFFHQKRFAMVALCHAGFHDLLFLLFMARKFWKQLVAKLFIALKIPNWFSP